MLSFLHRQKNIKVLGVEVCEDGNRYVLAECGRDINVLYKGMELPAFSFDGVAFAANNILEYSLPIRNVTDKEMLTLLHNEMQVSWGLKPAEHKVTWCRPKDNHDVLIGVWKNINFADTLGTAQTLSKEVLALTPIRRNSVLEEDLYDAALHAIKVACGRAKDINFAVLLQNEKKEQLRLQRYVLATKGVVVFSGIIFTALLFLYSFSYYKVYTLNKILTGMANTQEQYDWYLSKSGQINILQGIKTKILGNNKFRTEQVEQILDAMPEYNSEITFLRTQEIRDNNRKSSGIVLEGQVGDIRQLKQFVENLNRIGKFSKVTIGTGKNISSGAVGYTINISYGDGGNER